MFAISLKGLDITYISYPEKKTTTENVSLETPIENEKAMSYIWHTY